MSGRKRKDSDWQFVGVVMVGSDPVAEFSSPDHRYTGRVIRMNAKAVRERIANLQAHGTATPAEHHALVEMSRATTDSETTS